ncbi:MAG: SHOCT domain-containing protein [Rhodocyclaceae bacterium]|nr:MAG: SHOCT domain-containing protein [Rhodocyclaceae bacterium]
MYGFEHGEMLMGWGWFGMVLMWVIPVAIIVAMVRLFIWRPEGTSRQTAREILEERYARGEIERDDYLKRLGDLSK